MSSFASIRTLLIEFGIDPAEATIEDKGNNGGYSGGRIWKITSQSEREQCYCLKQWPTTNGNAEQLGRQKNQLLLVYKLLKSAANSQYELCALPIPVISKHGLPWTITGGQVSELQPWLRGRPTFWESPNDDKLIDACRTLAKFHKATESFDTGEVSEGKRILSPEERGNTFISNRLPPTCLPSESSSQTGSPPGIDRRIQFIDELNSGLRNRIGQLAVRQNPLGQLATNLLQNFDRLHANLRFELSTVKKRSFQLQFCVRDIWHDHLFFVGDKVSGIVDFGAVAKDNIAADLSRMLGSLIGNETSKWETGLQEYSSIRELSDAEMQLISAYDRSTTMLAGMNWLKWILLEKRTFESLEPIKERIERLLNRLADW